MRNFTFLEFWELLPQVRLFSIDSFYICGHIFTMAMQDVINKMKGTALGVAEYLTPVLKVRSHLPITSSYLLNWCSISGFLNFFFFTGIKISRYWGYYTRGSECTVICLHFLRNRRNRCLIGNTLLEGECYCTCNCWCQKESERTETCYHLTILTVSYKFSFKTIKVLSLSYIYQINSGLIFHFLH